MYMYSHESAEQKEFLRKLRAKKRIIAALRVLLLVFIIASWEAVTRLNWLDPFIFSSPSRIVKTFIRLYNEGTLFSHVFTTLWETVVGFLLGTVLGIVIAIVLWLSETCSRVLEPYLVVLNALPKIALGPVFIVWMGAGPVAIITVAVTVSLIVTVLEVYTGFLETDSEKIRLVQSFGANRKQILTKVVLPSSFPVMMNALKVNVGMSWVGVIVGEFLVSRAGLGYLIVYGGQVFQLDLVMTSVLILSVLAALMYFGVQLLGKWISAKY
ncbi:ABC transporter permease protein [Thermoclostridium stercorarium subsp. stercorarium DSM 8532]|jgi:NitT/TauT family transport system permease protein|uniref:ABC transporter permease protein n=3 Tax=Thermoclostridium stercorarium TaxID=1510 RepID=L7VNM3_THES1|nr:ABC transporter permease protein [Thermoclostridium stercorarium subsp. stercorarium DSM 8532]